MQPEGFYPNGNEVQSQSEVFLRTTLAYSNNNDYNNYKVVTESSPYFGEPRAQRVGPYIPRPSPRRARFNDDRQRPEERYDNTDDDDRRDRRGSGVDPDRRDPSNNGGDNTPAYQYPVPSPSPAELKTAESVSSKFGGAFDEAANLARSPIVPAGAGAWAASTLVQNAVLGPKKDTSDGSSPKKESSDGSASKKETSDNIGGKWARPSMSVVLTGMVVVGTLYTLSQRKKEKKKKKGKEPNSSNSSTTATISEEPTTYTAQQSSRSRSNRSRSRLNTNQTRDQPYLNEEYPRPGELTQFVGRPTWSGSSRSRQYYNMYEDHEFCIPECNIRGCKYMPRPVRPIDSQPMGNCLSDYINRLESDSDQEPVPVPVPVFRRNETVYR